MLSLHLTAPSPDNLLTPHSQTDALARGIDTAEKKAAVSADNHARGIDSKTVRSRPHLITLITLITHITTR